MAHDFLWAKKPLYRYLVEILPSFQTTRGYLSVPMLSESLGISREGIYRWFRAGSLHPRNARRLCELANTPDNLALLERVGGSPPELRNFDEFVYVD